MNSISLSWRIALFTMLLACFASAGSAAESADLGQAAGSVTVPAGVARADVQDAMVRALLGRQWEVKSKGDDRVVGYLKHRSNEATLTLIHTDGKVDLFCVGWAINKKTGAREKPEHPKGWLNYIKGDLAKLLSKPAAK